jgi:hypothetical protein
MAESDVVEVSREKLRQIYAFIQIPVSSDERDELIFYLQKVLFTPVCPHCGKEVE